MPWGDGDVRVREQLVGGLLFVRSTKVEHLLDPNEGHELSKLSACDLFILELGMVKDDHDVRALAARQSLALQSVAGELEQL